MKKTSFYKKFKPKNTTIPSSQHIGATYLVIVESPSKCSKIEHYLGHDYRCIASKGHIRELAGLKNIDIKGNFHPTFTIVSEKADHIQHMKTVIDEFPKKNIILATDDDREGEGIAWHICQVFGLPVETTPRIVFHEITETAVKSAIQSPTVININLVYAQHARQVLDVIVGFKISPFLWKHIHRGKTKALSAGRCQTPALRLVYDNHVERERAGMETRYKTTGHFFTQNILFELNHEFETVEDISDFLERSKPASHKHVFSLDQGKEVSKSPPKPFNTSRLLQTASNVLHTSPKQTMQLCQTLYQNGHITYMRTDNQKYAPAFLETVKQFVPNEYGGVEYLGQLENIMNLNQENPHEAIRVTNINIRNLPENADTKDASMYRLIWRNTVESCMSVARYNAITASISSPAYKNATITNDIKYKHLIEIPLFLGWKKVSSSNLFTSTVTDDEDKHAMNPQSRLLYFQSISKKIAEDVPYSYIESAVVIRNKHSHYTEASLIQTLENLGIGRPSTYAMLVDTIQDRGYVVKHDIKGTEKECVDFKLRSGGILDKIQIKKIMGGEKNKLAIQPIGILCIEFLIKSFETLFSYGYTKSMEEQLDTIANFQGRNQGQSENQWYELCRKCFLEIQEISKPLERIGKTAYSIVDGEGAELVFQEFGPSIRTKGPDGKFVYKSVKPDLDIDLEKAKAGEYTLSELVLVNKECLGQYEEQDVFLKTGKFGPYLKWGDNTQSLKTIGIPLEQLDLEKAIEFLTTIKEGKLTVDHTVLNADGTRPPPAHKSKSILRALSSDFSIRSGKFGPYIFYQTTDMKKPEFYPMKKCPHKYETCSTSDMIQWITTTYLQK